MKAARAGRTFSTLSAASNSSLTTCLARSRTLCASPEPSPPRRAGSATKLADTAEEVAE
ncbi:hypothetical protein K701_26125 [Streptomyces fradiae ATCC 10745 = DSM 40063]|uniref:Uncharacterized protein n=1 Tax=Streptomyces fradiae ATCC 10745 = DSM 40063 TaxID=1319510 RepID=A0ABQ6XM90_STRFR|nr:hypothetical protein K701_26125 [Streptomyces fradiae ATCC 10745 = DSM 40063]